MTSFQKIWDVAEDNHGVITTAQALELGVGAADMVSMARNRKLVRIGHGVYKLEMHSPGQYDDYAAAVALVGETGFVRGASSLAMRGLLPFDPSCMYLGVSRRLRRNLPPGYSVKRVAEPDIEYVEGIPVERITSAIADARASGAADEDALQAVEAMR